jgi:trehalose 6-phosphate synthase/phosphatase
VTDGPERPRADDGGNRMAGPGQGTAAGSGDTPDALAAEVFPASGALTLLIDYDGTLVPYADRPDQAGPDAALVRLLDAIARVPDVSLHIVSGRSAQDLARWFDHLPIDLWAEHGAVRRRHPGEPWETVVRTPLDWMEPAHARLARLTADTRGALLERKRTALAWHYRKVDPDLAAHQMARLDREMPAVLAGAPVDVLKGRMVVEFRPRGVTKALVVRDVLAGDSPSRIAAIGDDRTDEDMFAALPPSGIAIRVGGGATGARYALRDFRAVRMLLSLLLEARRPVPHGEKNR